MSKFFGKLLSFGTKVSNVLDDINDALNTADSKLQAVTNNSSISVYNPISYVASLASAKVQGTTRTDMSMLSNNYTVTAPTNQDLSHTPTVAQFMDIAHNGYVFKGNPDGVNPFSVDGKQLAIQDVKTGMAAKVWVTDSNQVVISYQGTSGGDSGVLNPFTIPAQIANDVQISNQQVSDAQKSALQFAKYVVNAAEKQGYNTNNIFVTGHSLGGSEASYVAQQTGLGGISFESTGIPSSSTAQGTGNNFVSIVTHGDPWAEYASDTAGNLSMVNSLPAGANGEFDHYGKVVMVGDKADSVALHEKLANWKSDGTTDVLTSMATVLPEFMKYHQLGTQAANMDIQFSQTSYTLDALYTQHGPVIPMGNDSLLQAMGRSVPLTTQS